MLSFSKVRQNKNLCKRIHTKISNFNQYSLFLLSLFLLLDEQLRSRDNQSTLTSHSSLQSLTEGLSVNKKLHLWWELRVRMYPKMGAEGRLHLSPWRNMLSVTQDSTGPCLPKAVCAGALQFAWALLIFVNRSFQRSRRKWGGKQ